MSCDTSGFGERKHGNGETEAASKCSSSLKSISKAGIGRVSALKVKHCVCLT